MSVLERLTERLDGVTPAGPGQFNARCPAHDDRSASLAVGEGDERVLIHCHAGCDVAAVLGELGLEWGDLFEGKPPANGGPVRLVAKPTLVPAVPASTSRRRIDDRVAGLPPAPVLEHWRQAIVGDVADRLAEVKGWSLPTLQALDIGWDGARVTIPVHDAGGAFTQLMRYLPGGKPKMMALPGRGRHLFPAPEAVQGDPLWLVEGETDAISAREIGLPAVAVPGVAIWTSEWGSRFAGRRVVVCFDCDAEGRRAARQRTADLIRAGVLAWHTDLAPDRDDGFDLSDALVVASQEGRVGDLRAYLGRLEAEAVGDGPEAA